MMMNSKKQLSELLSAMHFPRKGETLGSSKVIASSAVLDNDILKYEVVFPKGTKTKQVPTLLKKFFSMQVVPSHDNLVVRHHDYTVKPKAGNVAVVGAMHIPPVVRANPSVQDFDQDYSKMEMTNPETYFRKHDTAPLNSPQFRAKMFTFVSMMGENYGYGTDQHIFHRRASLIMPKIKITKAVPQAKMMYHTHPRKDEPSLSSPDDYLLYMDLSHEPRSIRHFYTVMADRMDYFTVKPKKNSKENYVKLNEDKILKELTDEMDDIEAKWDKKTPKTGDYQDDLRFCENITRDFVKWLNKRYSKYFTITYKCYYKVKKNPPEPEIEDLHLGDELLEKSLDSIKSRDYTWTPSIKTRAHEGSAYWHQLRYLDTLGNSAKTLGISPQGSMKRAYDTYMNKAFEESKFSYYDALNILNLAHDISSADSKIRDGGELSSRLTDICSYLELDETSTETLQFLEDVIHNENLFTEEAKTMCGDFYGLALLSSYAIQAVGAIQSVKEGKKEYSVVEYEVYSSLKEETQKRFEEFLLGEKDHRGYAMGENAPASRGFVDSFLNPPTVTTQRIELRHTFPTEAFSYDFDLVKEALDEFNVEKYEPAKSFVTGRNALNLRFPVTTGKVSMTIQPSTGTAQIFVTRRPNPMEDALDAVTKVGTALVRYGLPGIDPEEYDVKAIDAAQNPQSSQVIAIAGPSGAGKSTTIRNLLKLLPNSKTAPTVTTRAKRKSDKPGERIFISVEQFKKEMTQDKLVAAELQKNGNYYGRRKSDFKGADYVIIDVNPRGVNAIKRAYPNAFTVYLEPVEDPEFIRKRLLRRGDMSPQEARGRASIIPAHIKDSKNIDFDARIKTKQGEFSKIALEIEPMIPKQNPSKKPKTIRIEESPNKEKKLVAYFYDKDGKKFRTVHFGARGMSDFTQHKDPKRMKRYVARHGGMGENWKDPMTAGALSRWILWGKPSLRESFNDFKNRFKLEGVMAVTNTRMNPHHCPIEVEARRAAADPSFKHHEWYIEHHLEYVMAIAKAIVNSDEEEDQQLIHDMVWMHDYPKMLGDNDNFELVRELVSKHRSERYTDRLMNQLRWMEEIKSLDWGGRTTTIAAVMSTADALAHYYGPFWQIYMDENPDTPIEELKQSNAKKLEKDKRKLRAGPMEDGLDSVKFQYKGRKVRVVGNEHIAKLIERKNPRIPKKYEGQDPSEHSDLYTDEDPKGTIQGLGFKDKATAERSVNIIKRSGKTHAHKIQAAMAMEQRARFHPNATPGIKAAQKVYAKFIEEMKKKTKEMRKNPPQVYYHGSSVDNIKVLRKGSYVSPDYQTAYDMGRYHLDTKESWTDEDLAIPMDWGTRPTFKEGREPKGIPRVYTVELYDDDLIELGVDEDGVHWEYRTSIEAPVVKSNPKKTPEGRKIPKRYLKGLNKEEMLIAAKEIDKGYKYDIDDPKAYEYWKSDIQATARGYKTVPSKYKKKFIKMYGPLPEKGKFLDKMAKATKIKKSILQKVYDKGLAAWRGGHRPGVQQHQWAAGRVYSFVTLGNTVKKGGKKMPDYSLAVKAGLVKDNPSEADFFPGNKNVAPYYMTAQTIPITALQNPPYAVSQSTTHGKGLFATDDISEGVTLLDTENMQYLNHSSSPNIVFQWSDDELMTGVTSKDIRKGEEIVGDYQQLAKLTGHPAAGKDVPPETLFNPSEWRHGEFAEDDPFEEYF